MRGEERMTQGGREDTRKSFVDVQRAPHPILVTIQNAATDEQMKSTAADACSSTAAVSLLGPLLPHPSS